MQTLRRESGMAAAFLTAGFFFVFGERWLADIGPDFKTVALFGWIFGIMLWASFGVVRHAESLAHKLGEPYGTLVLTLSVITIEVSLISSVMLTGEGSPTLGREMMFSVLMLILNGVIGVSLLVGGLRHREQVFNLKGSSAFLMVLSALAVLSLILPDYTVSTADQTFSVPQAVFLIIISIGLYAVFLWEQTTRHREDFIEPAARASAADGLPEPARVSIEEEDIHSIHFHVALLLAHMLPIVYLSEELAVIVDFGLEVAHLPTALGGLMVATLVLAPEALASLRAAQANELQRSINISLGSALSTIGLTTPAVLAIGLYTGSNVVLGLDATDEVMLCLTLFVTHVHLSSGKSNALQGLVHLILLAAYVVLIFD